MWDTVGEREGEREGERGEGEREGWEREARLGPETPERQIGS